MKNSTYLLFLILILLLPSSILPAQVLSKKNIRYIHKNAINITLDTNYAGGNWEPIVEKVKNKKIVLIGELNHGVREIFLVRNDLIKALQEKAGFNVILFEAGIGEMFVVDLYKNKLSPKMMTYSLMGQWHTPEFEDLYTFVKSQNMSVGGFDIQRGFGGFFDKIAIEGTYSNKIDTALYKALEVEFISLKRKLANRKTDYSSVHPPTLDLIHGYNKIYKSLPSKGTNDASSIELAFLRKTLENRIIYLGYMLRFAKDKNYNRRWAVRDYSMSQNVKWLIENIYKDEKIIIVAHNFHIAKYNEQEKVMGAFLMEDFADDIYSIGTFIGGGTYWEGGKQKELAPVSKEGLDIKHIIQALDGRAHFMDIPAKTSKASRWMDEKIIVNDSFINLSRGNELILSKWFDGIILIDQSTIPAQYK